MSMVMEGKVDGKGLDSVLQSDDSESSHDVISALRTVHQHQAQLLILADQKANILVGILAVILTIIFTKVEYFTTVSNNMMIAVSIFILLESAALFLALLVIMPKTLGQAISSDIEKMPNPFFFGFYTRFTENQYLDYLSGKLRNDAESRDLLARDLYQTGQVLLKKYKLLKYTYLLAMVGILLLVIATIIHFSFG